MRSPFEKQQRERDELIKKETIELVVKIANMLDDNLSLEEISKETGFSLEQVKMIQQLSSRTERKQRVNENLKNACEFKNLKD
jgi:predicted transposase YdaD